MQQKKLALGMRFGAENAASPINNDLDLHIAVAQGSIQIVERLLAASVDVNTRDENGWTALHVAATRNGPRIADALLYGGADLEARFKDGATALHVAAHHGRSEVVRVLLKHGAELAARTHDGATALEIAAASRRTEALQAMVEHIGDLGNHENIVGPALHVAASRGNAACIRLLLEAGTSPDTKSVTEQRTPLMTAASSDNLEAAETLLDAGARIEGAIKGITAVLIAAFKSSTRVLQLLISRGANIDVVDENDWTPLRAAIYNNDRAVTRLLLQHRVRLNTTLSDDKDTALHLAVSRCNLVVVGMLLDSGADVEAADADGDTPLQWAVEKGDVDLVKTLLSHGAVIDRKNPNTGEVVLGWAVRCGHLGVTDCLISHGADRSLVDLDTLQKVHTADDQDFILCKSLVEAGVCSSVQDGPEETSLQTRPLSPPNFTNPDEISADRQLDSAVSAPTAGGPDSLQSLNRVEQCEPKDIASNFRETSKAESSLPGAYDTANTKVNFECDGKNDTQGCQLMTKSLVD